MRIPIYERQVVPNASAGTPSIDAGQAGRGMQELAGGLRDLTTGVANYTERVQQEQKRREEADGRVWFANAASKADLDMAEFLQKRQQAAQPGAAGFTPDYLKGFDEYTQAAIKNAPNDYARQLMQAHIAQSREAYGRAALTYEAGERVRYKGQQIGEGVQTSATLVNGNPGLFAREMGKWGGTIDASELDPADKAKYREAARSSLVNAAVVSWIDRRPQEALAILREMQKSGDVTSNVEFTENGQTASVPVKLGTLEERMKWAAYAETKAKQDKAQKFAGVLIDTASATVAAASLMPGDMVDIPQAKSSALAAAQSAMGRDLDPEERLQLEQRVEAAAADRERDIKRNREASVAWAFDALDKNGGDYQALIRDNPALATGLTTEQQTRINDYAGKVATGVTRPTDWQAYNQLISDPDFLKSANLDAIRDKFSAGEFAQLKKAQQDLLTTPGAEQNIVGTHSLIKGMLDNAGFKGNEKKQAKFFSLLQQAVDQELAATGKKSIPQTRVKELAQDLLVEEITARGMLIDDTDEAFDIDVPQGERIKIEAALISQGLPLSEYNVLQAYRNKLRKQMNPQPAQTTGKIQR